MKRIRYIALPLMGLLLSGCLLSSGEGNSTSKQKTVGPHDHVAGERVIEVETPVTCTENGYHYDVYKCTICGEEISRELIYDEAPGHDYEVKSHTEASKTEDGLYVYECSRCHDSYEVVDYAYGDKDQLEFTFDAGFSGYVVRAKSKSIAGNIVIPRGYNGYEVVKIDDDGFMECVNLTGIVIPNTVKYIGSLSFYGSGLTSVDIPGSIKNVSGFMHCPNLASVTLHEGTESIDEAFKECSSLTSVNLPSSLKSIYHAFAGCSMLNSIILPSSITKIGERAFERCSKLQTISLPSGLKEIATGAFDRCSLLKNISLPSGVEKIASSAFAGCSSLESIVIPDDITIINNSAFKGCSSLSSVILPASLEALAYSSFEGCSSLESIALPASVKNIYGHAFMDCTSLSQINIPDGIENIGPEVFANCTSLACSNDEGNAYLGSSSNPYLVLVHPLSSDVVTSSTHANCHFILDRAFKDCASLSSIDISSVCSFIGESCFENCASLSSISFSLSEVEILNAKCFQACTSLSSITLPRHLKEIGNSAFSGCTSLSSITLPTFVEAIDDYAFSGCTSLTSVTLNDAVTKIDCLAFSECPNLIYTITDGGKYLVNEFNTRAILMGLENSGVSSLTLRSDTAALAYWAIYYESSIVSITINKRIVYFNDQAISSNVNLTTLNYDGSIEDWAKVRKENYWCYNNGTSTLHCTDGDISI